VRVRVVNTDIYVRDELAPLVPFRCRNAQPFCVGTAPVALGYGCAFRENTKAGIEVERKPRPFCFLREANLHDHSLFMYVWKDKLRRVRKNSEKEPFSLLWWNRGLGNTTRTLSSFFRQLVLSLLTSYSVHTQTEP
jgi:hypothetical protein